MQYHIFFAVFAALHTAVSAVPISMNTERALSERRDDPIIVARIPGVANTPTSYLDLPVLESRLLGVPNTPAVYRDPRILEERDAKAAGGSATGISKRGIERGIALLENRVDEAVEEIFNHRRRENSIFKNRKAKEGQKVKRGDGPDGTVVTSIFKRDIRSDSLIY